MTENKQIPVEGACTDSTCPMLWFCLLVCFLVFSPFTYVCWMLSLLAISLDNFYENKILDWGGKQWLATCI